MIIEKTAKKVKLVCTNAKPHRVRLIVKLKQMNIHHPPYIHTDMHTCLHILQIEERVEGNDCETVMQKSQLMKRHLPLSRSDAPNTTEKRLVKLYWESSAVPV